MTEIPYWERGQGVKASREDVESAPLGTVAPAFSGGGWCRVKDGWQWNGHLDRCQGSTFPKPGGDWTGRLVYN